MASLVSAIGVANAFGEITDRDFSEDPPKPARKRAKPRKPAARAIVEERQRPKKKSASLCRMLKNKARI
jgi:hypothetical protein